MESSHPADEPDFEVIDSDAHVLEPGNLWIEYMDKKYRNIAPRFIQKPDGTEIFHVEDGNVVDLGAGQEEAFALAGGLGMREGNKPKGNSYYDGKPGGFDPHKRIPDMDKEGIDLAFLYPTIALFTFGMRNAEAGIAACRAYNRWLADYCSSYPDRLQGVALLPVHSAEATVAEIAYASKTLGFRGGIMPPNPIYGRPLHHPDNEPIWKAAQDHDFVIALHAGAAGEGFAVALGKERFTGIAANHCAVHTLEMAAAVNSFILCGICDRYPMLRVGFMEAGGGWVAGWLDRMDRHFDDVGMNDTVLTTRPSEIFRRQCFISFEPVEGTLPLLADYIGRTNILWATDYPHCDGFTDAPALIRKLGMPPDLLKDVMSTGAKRFYGLN